MVRFFVNRPVVAIVIAILITIVGLISLARLPVAQYPNIVPPEIWVIANYVGADALTVEEAVATPIEEQMNGVENMQYMYSINSNDGRMILHVLFGVNTDPNTDLILAQIRESQAESQIPAAVRNYGITMTKSYLTPMMVLSLYSPQGTHDPKFLANYAFINLNDPLLRIPGIGQVGIFGAGQYAMRLWVNPDTLAKMDITVNEILTAITQQNTVNPAGKIGGEPVPPGQQFTYAVRAQGRLVKPEEFADIIVRAKPDGSVVRIKDVARVELGAQDYSVIGSFNGKPSAIVALYQLPGSNALDTANQVRAFMEKAKARFPADLAYTISLDTTRAVREGIKEILITLLIAIGLVLLVVFFFLQNLRATIIPMCAVPVSLIGTFILFPILGFSINTISLLGMVLAVGLVVDDAIIVVEAVERHIEQGEPPKEATLNAMKEVQGPVVAVALVLVSVFIPTIFIPGITGRLYTQFAITIAISVSISAFNALSLSPALSAMLLRPRKGRRGLWARFFGWFNRTFQRATDSYVNLSGTLIRKAIVGVGILLILAFLAVLLKQRLPGGFVPEEDQGYFFINLQLPKAASLQRTEETILKVSKMVRAIPAVEYTTEAAGFSMLSTVRNTFSGFIWVTLKDWSQRTRPEEKLEAVMQRVNGELAKVPGAQTFAFSPPAIPGIGSAGGVTFILEDRAGKEISFLADNTDKFLAAARHRPEIASANTTLLANVPQVFADVNRAMVLVQGVNLGEVYRTLQSFMGGVLVNYFNRFGRVWQVYVQAEGDFRTRANNVGRFYVRNALGQSVPLASLVATRPTSGPEFTMRFNEYRSAQINVTAAPGFSSAQAMNALEQVFGQTMPREMGFNYFGMSYQEWLARQGVPAFAVFTLSLIFVFLLLAALYESWSLPFSVLLTVPIAVFGAFLALWLRGLVNNIFAQIGLIMVIGLSAKNAILIVEFAKSKHEAGLEPQDAALQGARLRLRPILMTSFAFIFGCVPLWVAMGPGAVARRDLGTIVIGGMAASTLIAIFIIPLTFYLVEKFRSPWQKGPPGGKAAPSASGKEEP
ncbi:MAG: efflux RND transporter permease subunit [Syntrophobacterales bacterium]|jgi:HAE1 family hydrophobic/amphiphilic exporter-1